MESAFYFIVGFEIGTGLAFATLYLIYIAWKEK